MSKKSLCVSKIPCVQKGKRKIIPDYVALQSQHLFEGPRKVVLAMGGLVHLSDVEIVTSR